MVKIIEQTKPSVLARLRSRNIQTSTRDKKTLIRQLEGLEELFSLLGYNVILEKIS